MKNINLQLEANISSINIDEENTICTYQLKAKFIYDLVLQLKSFILNYDFCDINEEIDFFKVTKPKLLSEFIFNITVLNILINKPPGNSDTLLKYYENNLNKITCFFNKHKEFHQYYRLKITCNDSNYFVRKKSAILYLTDFNSINLEPAFSSSHDYLVAQIIANDHLEAFLKNEIDLILHKDKTPHVVNMWSSSNQNIQWTDSKSALIELIYALYSSNSLNNGHCDIREIAAIFEKAFNVRINDIYRGFQDIKLRNTPTRFIDNLKASLLKKIDEDFE